MPEQPCHLVNKYEDIVNLHRVGHIVAAFHTACYRECEAEMMKCADLNEAFNVQHQHLSTRDNELIDTGNGM